jgi:sodium/bile acid cotransporter 2
MRGAVLLAMAGTAMAAVGPNGDKALECRKTTCLDTKEDEVQFSCGATGEVLEIDFASFGEPVGACPAANVEAFNDTVLAFEEKTGCSFKGALDKLKELCDGEDTCDIKVSDLFKGTDGLESCTGAAEDYVLLARGRCVNVFDPFQLVIALVIGMIGLALGASVEIHQFKTIFREHKRAVAIGFGCQFGIMPLLAYLFCITMDFTPAAALGLVLVGSAPGGTTSNLVTYWAKGSVALSITMSACSTLASLGFLPLLVLIYIKGALSIDDSISIPFGDIAKTLIIAIFPAALGVWVRSKNANIAKKVEIGGSILGALFIAAALYIGIKRNPDLLKASEIPKAWTAAMLLQPTGALLGYVIAIIARLPRPERRAVGIETGIQNTTLVVAMVALSFSGCERLEILTFPLLCSLTSLINSAWMAPSLRLLSRWDTEEEKANLYAEKQFLEGDEGALTAKVGEAEEP